MTPLRRKMREDMQIRNYASTTQKGYLWRVGQFARHYLVSLVLPGLGRAK